MRVLQLPLSHRLRAPQGLSRAQSLTVGGMWQRERHYGEELVPRMGQEGCHGAELSLGWGRQDSLGVRGFRVVSICGDTTVLPAGG